MTRKFGIKISIILGLFILFSGVFYIRSVRPIRQAEKQALEFASKYVDIEQVSDFYWFTREESYFTIVGTTADSKDVVVFIPQKGDRIKIMQQDEGLSRDDAINKIEKEYSDATTLKVSLGIFKDQPVWEVVTENKNKSLNYYLISFTTGNIQTILEEV